MKRFVRNGRGLPVSAHSADATSDSFSSEVIVLFLHSVSTMGDVHLGRVAGKRYVRECQDIRRKTNSAVQATGSIVGTTVVLLGTETVESAPLQFVN